MLPTTTAIKKPRQIVVLKLNNKLFFIVAVIFITLFTPLFKAPGSVQAVSASEWKASNIIDDAIFYDNHDMSANDIQVFLNNKVVCDTWGSKPSEYGGGTRAQYGTSRGYPPPYTCLQNYTQDGKSAAQIIKEAADTYHISARGLIVLMQKEQALVTDQWPWPNQYRSATGYGCPDTAPCDAEYYGFRNQVMKAAYQFRRYATYPSEYRYKPYQVNYIQYNPISNCGGTNVNIENLATAGLYNYTPYQPNSSALNNLYGSGDSCGAYGNRNFWRLFNDWFGSTKSSAYNCDSRITNIVCVWSMSKSDGSQFITPSLTERNDVIKNYGWRNEGIAFYASSVQKQGMIPVYRLRINDKHYYTGDATERINLLNAGGWIDEGVSFYAYSANESGNVTHQIYTLYKTNGDKHFITGNTGRRQLLLQEGYYQVSSTFKGVSGSVDLPLPASGRMNVYRLSGSSTYFYTTSLIELETVVDIGYTYEAVTTTANMVNSGTPVYRLRYGGNYFYTSDVNERNIAINSYGMSNEGVAFYLDDESSQVYRLKNAVTGRYLLTSSVDELMSVTNLNGWQFENTLLSKSQSLHPVHRFLNINNHRHFYTISLQEGVRITNRGWKYESEVFSASTNAGIPVYRLLFRDKHLFTVNTVEKNIAVSNYGYLYEGIAFYVSPPSTDRPVYRLQGGNDEYFYTSSSSERDTALGQYGYHYEGIGFYLP
jgi:hypothetical protein